MKLSALRACDGKLLPFKARSTEFRSGYPPIKAKMLFVGTQSHKHCRRLHLALESIRLDELGEMAKIKR
jgi:hypothetical protein